MPLNCLIAVGSQLRRAQHIVVQVVKGRAVQHGDGPAIEIPYVKHVEKQLAQLGLDFRTSGIGIAAISSNDAENYPGDAPASLAEQALKLGFAFPYLYDDTQDVARAYDATCTPDFFLFNSTGALVYRGQLDSSRPGNDIPVTGRDLRAALQAVLAGEPVAQDQRPSVGCNIKWKGRW